MGLLNTSVMKKIKYILFLILIFIMSCSVKEKLEIKNTGDLNDAITNVIIDFSKTGKSSKNNFYYVSQYKNSKNLYCFNVSNTSKIYLHLKDSIGVKTKYFPTQFKEINKRLYIWEDSTVVISKQMLDRLQKYNVLDSTFYKIQKGLLPKSTEVYFTSNELKKSFTYYVCKTNISKFVKIYTNRVSPISKYPEVDCK